MKTTNEYVYWRANHFYYYTSIVGICYCVCIVYTTRVVVVHLRCEKCVNLCYPNEIMHGRSVMALKIWKNINNHLRILSQMRATFNIFVCVVDSIGCGLFSFFWLFFYLALTLYAFNIKCIVLHLDSLSQFYSSLALTIV